ncbi:hypothetical protein, partial [Streptomyces olivaceiscleroticus]|uniref:hypothetical protein n=1 Tax=Streptomyces olivaceiscleroticus TaxID=68245 RepID=UPI0031F93511
MSSSMLVTSERPFSGGLLLIAYDRGVRDGVGFGGSVVGGGVGGAGFGGAGRGGAGRGGAGRGG